MLHLEYYHPEPGEDLQFDECAVRVHGIEAFTTETFLDTGEIEVLTGEGALLHEMTIFLDITKKQEEISEAMLQRYFLLMEMNARIPNRDIRRDVEELNIRQNPEAAFHLLMSIFSPERWEGIKKRAEEGRLFPIEEETGNPQVDITLDEWLQYEKTHIPCSLNGYMVAPDADLSFTDQAGYVAYRNAMREFYGK